MNTQIQFDMNQQPPNKIKICRYCRSQIDKKAKVCPFCKKKQGSGCGTVILLVIIIFCVVIVLSGGCSSFITGYKNGESKSKARQEASQYSESDYKAACKEVTYEDIARDKDALKGQKVTFTGEIVQASSGVYRMNVTKGDYFYSDTILFTIDESSLSQNILEDDIVTIWGESQGMYTYEAVLGNEVTVPRIYAVYLQDFGKPKE